MVTYSPGTGPAGAKKHFKPSLLVPQHPPRCRGKRGSKPPGIDAFVARIPRDETRTDVERVLRDFARYQYLAGGAAAVTPPSLDSPHAPARPDDVF